MPRSTILAGHRRNRYGQKHASHDRPRFPRRHRVARDGVARRISSESAISLSVAFSVVACGKEATRLSGFGSTRNADSALKSLCRLARRPLGNHVENKRRLSHAPGLLTGRYVDRAPHRSGINQDPDHSLCHADQSQQEKLRVVEHAESSDAGCPKGKK